MQTHDYTVYIHVNKENGMRYVGITAQKVSVRWQNGNGYRKQEHFWRAIQKYGWDGFHHEIVASGLSAEDAYLLEKELIAKYKTADNRNGYNKSTGGEAGAKGVEKNDLQRRVASESLKRKWTDEAFRRKIVECNLPKTQTEEARRKRAESHRGRRPSEETRKRMSENRKGIKPPPFTEEHKARIREHHAGGAAPLPVVCIETNELFSCINEAARKCRINKKQISGCCKGVPHYNTAGGLHWKYADEVKHGAV